MSIYEITVKDNKGNDVNLGEYRGKVLLIVNTATGCGFTPQYDGLQDLYDKYQEKGLEILDFPCNQFLNQAPGSADEIASFCQVNFGITFRQFAKIKVNGKEQSPLYEYLKSQQKGSIKWNFTKFLVDRDGNVVARFAPTVTPVKLDAEIEKLL